MGLFGKRKNKEEEYDDEDELEEESASRKSSRGKGKYASRIASKDFKDLNPSDRKKRTEPAKPWGKMERLVILAMILLTTAGSGYFALAAREFKLPGIPRIKVPKLTMPAFFREETIVLEGNAKDTKKSSLAINAFNEATQNLSGVYGFYVIDPNTGFSYGLNENEIFQAASLIKLPVMVGMYMEMEAGRLKLEDKYRLKESDKLPGSGSLYGKQAGYELTYKNIIRLMGKESDNTAFNIARKYLGDARIAEIINSVGMTHTNLGRNETTPKDVGVFFEELTRGNIIGKDNAQELLLFLTDTKYEDWLSAGLPEGVSFSHKYGREVHVVNDAGYVSAVEDSQSFDPFVLVVLSKGIVDREADMVFPELGRIIFNVESGN